MASGVTLTVDTGWQSRKTPPAFASSKSETLSSTAYRRGRPRPGSSGRLPTRPAPQPGTLVDKHFLVLKAPAGFSGILAADLRRPPRRVVLKRADARLERATKDELHAFFHVEPHVNVAVPDEVISHHHTLYLVEDFMGAGTMRAWIAARHQGNVRCWAPPPPAPVVVPTIDVRPHKPLWGLHTICRAPYRAPTGKSVVMSTARALRTGTLYLPPRALAAQGDGSLVSSLATTLPGTGFSTPQSKRTVAPLDRTRRPSTAGSASTRGSARSRRSSRRASPTRLPWDGDTSSEDESALFEDVEAVLGEDVDPEEVLLRARLALGAARGLRHLHQRHALCHLDFHPGNALMEVTHRPRKAHPRSRKVRRAYYNTKVAHYGAVQANRVLLRTASRVGTSRLLVTLSQSTAGAVTATAFDASRGVTTEVDVADATHTMTSTMSALAATTAGDGSAEDSDEEDVVLSPAAVLVRPRSILKSPLGSTLPRRPMTVTWGSTQDLAGMATTWGFATGATQAPFDATVADFSQATTWQVDTLAARLLAGEGGHQGMAGFRAPEQRRAGSGAITPQSDVYAFGLTLGFLVSGEERRVRRREARDGLVLTYEPLREYFSRCFPREARRRCPVVMALATLALHCVAHNPASRPSAAACVMLLETAIEGAGEAVEQPVDDVPLRVDDASMRWLNEARYLGWARRDWRAAAACLDHMDIDPHVAPTSAVDWRPVWSYIMDVKRGLSAGSHGLQQFPVLEQALHARGVLGHLTLRVFPVHEAVRTGDLAELRVLLDSCQGTTLHGAMRREVVKWWDTDEAFARQLQALLPACSQDAMRGLLLEEVDADGETPLRVAAAQGQEAMVRALLKAGAVLESRNDNFKEAATHKAAAANAVGVLYTLMLHGAEPNTRDRAGYTPLHVAASRGHVDAARVLLEWGASVDVLDRDHRSPLHIGVVQGHRDVVKLCIAWGARVNNKAPVHNNKRIDRRDFETPYDLALRSGQRKMARTLKAASKAQRTCNRPGCDKRTGRGMPRLQPHAACRTAWYCSDTCEAAHAGRHAAKCVPPHFVWPKRDIPTPWGPAVLLRQTLHDGDGEGYLTADLVAPNGGRTTLLHVCPFKLAVFLGQEVEVPVHYELVYPPMPPPVVEPSLGSKAAAAMGRAAARAGAAMGDATSRALGNLTAAASVLRGRLAAGASSQALKAKARLRGVAKSLSQRFAGKQEEAGPGYWYCPNELAPVDGPLPSRAGALASAAKNVLSGFRARVKRSLSPMRKGSPLAALVPKRWRRQVANIDTEPTPGYWYHPEAAVERSEDPLPRRRPPGMPAGVKATVARAKGALQRFRKADKKAAVRKRLAAARTFAGGMRDKAKAAGRKAKAKASLAVEAYKRRGEPMPEPAGDGYWYAGKGALHTRWEDPVVHRGRRTLNLAKTKLTAVRDRSKERLKALKRRLRREPDPGPGFWYDKVVPPPRRRVVRSAVATVKAKWAGLRASRRREAGAVPAALAAAPPGFWYAPLGSMAAPAETARGRQPSRRRGGGMASRMLGVIRNARERGTRMRSASPSLRGVAASAASRFGAFMKRVRGKRRPEAVVEGKVEDGEGEEVVVPASDGDGDWAALSALPAHMAPPDVRADISSDEGSPAPPLSAVPHHIVPPDARDDITSDEGSVV